MKIFCNKKILIILLISLFCVMTFNIKVFAEETDSTGNEEFTLSEESLEVELNRSKYLSCNGGDTSKTVTWTSSDSTVATVNETGYVSALKIGTATITATRGDETASCIVNVIYDDIQIGSNEGNNAIKLNLVLGEHETESLYTIVKDYYSNVINNAQVEWSSSDSNVVTVEKTTGKLKAIKPGTATITAKAAGVTDTCEVTVYAAPEFTDFSKAKYELLFDYNTQLKISGITPADNNYYHYIITSNNTKPTVTIAKNGSIDWEAKETKVLSVNKEEKYIYSSDLNELVELNQDLYLWIIQEVKLGGSYYTEEQENIYYTTKFVVEGEKLTRPELPQLNLIVKGFDIYSSSDSSQQSTWMTFRFPSATENRKFTLNIGKVTDNKILKKIQNNDYSGITELLSYAKNNEAIYTSNLTTTRENYYGSDQILFDGNALLTDDAYYYIYVVFDDENGKYYPIQGVTLAQAYLNDYDDTWYLYGYTSEDFEWNNLESTTPPEKDDTTAPTEIPKAGSKAMMAVIIVVSTIGVVFYKKSNKLRDIK